MMTSGSTVVAQADADTIAELRAQITALANRLEELERSNEVLSTAVESNQSSVSASSATSWADRLEISGDIRPRYEYIADDLESSDRNRNRVRARVSIGADLGDNWNAEVGLASGGTNPISTNQSFGGGGFTKDLRLDLAYVTYSGFEDTEITAGKYRNVFFRPGGQNMIFDGDFRPEGIALAYERNQLFFNAGTMFLESDDKHDSQDKEQLWGVQLGYGFSLDGGSLTLGTSYFDASVKGSRPFYEDDPYNNSVDENGRFLNDYQEWELFAEANLSLAGQPLRLYADYVKNLDADEFDTGWTLGALIGRARSQGSWEIGYGYQDLEADAILGSLTDSDFAGGGTDNEGHIINAAYALSDSTRIGLTYFINEYGQARFGEKEDYDRLHFYVTLGF